MLAHIQTFLAVQPLSWPPWETPKTHAFRLPANAEGWERVAGGPAGQRGHDLREGAVYGVPASAGKVLSFEGDSKHLEIHREAASDRLKPGLHTLCPSSACEIGGLDGVWSVWAKPAASRRSGHFWPLT